MKMKLSLVTLALLQVGVAQAASFNLNQANLDNLNKDKWQCKRCTTESRYSGEIGASVIAVDSDDAKAANRFGDEDGEALALQADLVVTDAELGRLSVDADDFGAETGSMEAKWRRDGLSVNAGYRSHLQVNADDATSAYGINGGTIAEVEPHQRTLERKRETYLVGAEQKGANWRGFIDYQYQDITGKYADSSQFIGAPSGDRSGAPINYIAPLDQQIQTLVAGGEVSGERWLAALKYQGSRFDNDHTGVDAVSGGSIKAYSPDNEAHQVIAQGQYRFDRHSVSGRVAKGWMIQDEDFTSLNGVPAGIHSADAEVETLDVNARWHHRASADLRIKAKFDYRERDNQTPVRLFESIDYDPNKGRAVENVALDSERWGAQIEADYRWMDKVNLNYGFEFKDKELTDEVTEDTQDSRFFAGLRYQRLQNWDLHLEAEYSSRDGSDYQADEATSDEDNAAKRKYHLADRDRQEYRIGATHTPLDNLTVDVNLRYALDDYSDTEIGLRESEDYGYDLSVNYQPMAKLDLYLFAGQQWIDSEQSDLNHSGSYNGEISDQFSHIGVGTAYRGWLQEKLTVGVDYGFSESESDTDLSSGVSYGDYRAWSHNVDLYAEYQLSAKAKVKANYGYERYYDTDYGSVASSNYTTLGNLDSNYVAHKVMLTFSYAL